eukprot:CAMPEP_0119356264 /NCGR_PEP_ID=MMETSP1334-20130426/4906_1 /TAXON_ID=127549 /ORGANISM="Calcidiscus leptoporus, Strain RCC1130" /LENGTH=214 /DNA_ID=CAMNT_0007370257 /DNA_START=69 /DNA_END=713 /DNA_ORIENTATION=-
MVCVWFGAVVLMVWCSSSVAATLPPAERPLLFNSRQVTASATRSILRPLRKLRRGLPRGRWLLEYADVRPLDARSTECQLFLATNVAFFAAGSSLVGAEPALALQLELAGAGSVWYHYNQCSYGGTSHPAVQLAMLIDYAFAIPTALNTAFLAADLGGVPPSALALAMGAVAALVSGWRWEGPRTYMALHGAWHFLSAGAAYQVATAHAHVHGV